MTIFYHPFYPDRLIELLHRVQAKVDTLLILKKIT